MNPLHQNIILDLLPAYIAGEASEESRALVEVFADNDPEIARLIQTGKLQSEAISAKTAMPDDLEMRTIKRIRRSIRRQMMYVAMVTASILMVPLVAMFFTREVNWTLFDFVVAGVLLSGTGLAYVFISRLSNSTAYRTAVAIAVVSGLLLIWINLAVGIIGSENNPANQLYGAVLFTGFIGAVIARFKPQGMARTMYATALIQMLIPFIAMLVWRPALDNPPGIIGVFMLNTFFAALFLVSGLLFKRAY